MWSSQFYHLFLARIKTSSAGSRASAMVRLVILDNIIGPVPFRLRFTCADVSVPEASIFLPKSQPNY